MPIFCQGKVLCRHSSLATKAPRQTRYLDKGENAKTPEQTFAGSGFCAEWQCPICSHEWQCQVAQCVRNDCGCPQCSRIDSRRNMCTHPTFEAVQLPPLWNGTMSATPRTTFIPKTSPLAVESWCIGSATSAPRDSCTGIKCLLLNVPENQLQVVHTVPAGKCAIATLWQFMTHLSHQSGILG